MKETFYPTPRELKFRRCDREDCQEDPDQEYTVILNRPNIRRVWTFCSLKHLQEWAGPDRRTRRELNKAKRILARDRANARPMTTHNESTSIPRIA